MSTARRYNHALHVLCPHCATPGAVRTSRQITPVCKEFYIDCRNPHCGHSWLAQLHVVHSITPSAIPDATLHIRMGPTMAQRLRAEADTRINGPPANDDDAARLQG